MKRILFSLLISLFSTLPLSAAPKLTETVILLHGIAKSERHMRPIAEYLAARGYHVVNIDYPSTEHDLAALTTQIAQQITDQTPEDHTVHFVGYSMGGILTRLILAQHRPDNLGRVVTLGTPHGGSEVADTLANVGPYKWYFGPAGQQLTTDAAGIAAQLPPIDYPLGAIAGNRSVDPVSSAIIPGKDDGKVSITSALPEAAADRIILPVSHLYFPKHAIVHDHIARFLETGQFRAP